MINICKMSAYTYVVLYFILFCVSWNAQATETEPKHNTSHEWDLLIFTQHWPVTTCYQWQEKAANNKCSLPTLKDIWTVHGIWPTKLHTDGPNFCNSSWKFDPSQLYPLQKQLEIYWLNIEKNTPLYAFWKHEWKKHGTCATSLPDFDSESKYFNRGLTWIDKYDMATVLAKGGIVPNVTSGYQTEEIYNAVRNVLNKNPIIECIYDKKTGESFISEIRICFDKNLELMDCDSVKDRERHIDHERIITNCNPKYPIMYTNIVPTPPTVVPKLFSLQNSKSKFDVYWLIDIYRFINLLRWFTL